MKYTREEVMEFIRQEDVKFIRLAFSDISGRQKNIAIMPSELDEALKSGIKIDASPIDGFDGEIILKPDTSTLTELPWRPQHGRVAHLFCDLYAASGEPIATDPRHMLKAAAEENSALVSFNETFYLKKLSDGGEPTDIPHDRAGYMDIAPEDKGENVRREICLTLERMGVAPTGSRHERGPGQHTVTYAASDPITAADNAVMFRAVVRAIAAQYGLYADFSPSPVDGEAPNVQWLTVNGETEKIESSGENPYTLVRKHLIGR